MTRFAASVTAVLIASIVASGAAFAQVTAPSKPAPTATEKATTITKEQWNRMKGKWAQEKEKWADCRKQSKSQKLSGTKSWTFIASCMTT
jgi:hypothetical protein